MNTRAYLVGDHRNRTTNAMNTRANLVGDHRNRTTNAMSACAKSPPAATRA